VLDPTIAVVAARLECPVAHRVPERRSLLRVQEDRRARASARAVVDVRDRWRTRDAPLARRGAERKGEPAEVRDARAVVGRDRTEARVDEVDLLARVDDRAEVRGLLRHRADELTLTLGAAE